MPGISEEDFSGREDCRVRVRTLCGQNTPLPSSQRPISPETSVQRKTHFLFSTVADCGTLGDEEEGPVTTKQNPVQTASWQTPSMVTPYPSPHFLPGGLVQDGKTPSYKGSLWVTPPSSG